jgi:hypothetical protein
MCAWRFTGGFHVLFLSRQKLLDASASIASAIAFERERVKIFGREIPRSARIHLGNLQRGSDVLSFIARAALDEKNVVKIRLGK